MLSNLWSKLIAVGVFLLGILGLALKLISIGKASERARADKVKADVKAKIKENLAETAHSNAQRENKAHENATNDDWSGFNDKPDGM